MIVVRGGNKEGITVELVKDNDADAIVYTMQNVETELTSEVV